MGIWKFMITYNEIPAVLEQIQRDLQRVLSLLDSQKEKGKDDDTLLTRQDVKGLLKVSFATIHNWAKTKRLKKFNLGGRVYYRYRDIMDMLKM